MEMEKLLIGPHLYSDSYGTNYFKEHPCQKLRLLKEYFFRDNQCKKLQFKGNKSKDRQAHKRGGEKLLIGRHLYSDLGESSMQNTGIFKEYFIMDKQYQKQFFHPKNMDFKAIFFQS